MISVQSLHQICNTFSLPYIEYLISTFQCPLNMEVERFLKEKAILYEKYNLTRTYLIFDVQEENKTVELLAYFSLAIKEFTFDTAIPNRSKRKILNTGFQADQSLAALLLAQLGKNSDPSLHHRISGEDILYLAFKEIMRIYEKIGGRITYVEAMDDHHLQAFYEKHHFVCCKTTEGEPVRNPSGFITYVKALPKCI